MKKLFLLFTVCILSFVDSFAALNPGDIAFVQYNADADNYAFVALVNIAAGEVINFTDNGWLSSGSFRGGEGTETWTAPSSIDCGDVITLSGLTGLSGSGDQILAYQGTSASPTFIAAINNEGAGVWQANATSSNTSALPTGLTNGTNAVAVNEVDNVVYDGSTLVGTGAAVGAAINTNGAWAGGSNTVEQTFSGTFDITGCVPLPVELINFSAKKQRETIELAWSTASEENNSHFEVEYSTNGRDFQLVDKVNGNGTTAEIQTYQFTHTDAAAGKNYYRLRQVDFDGAFEYSSVVVVTMRTDAVIEIRPTVVASYVQVVLEEGLTTDVDLQIVDITGQQLQTGMIAKGTSQIDLNVDELSKGAYFIQFNVAGEVITRRFVKM